MIPVLTRSIWTFSLHNNQSSEDRRIRIVIIGASVSGLTFHATLATLMREHPTCPNFHELFSVSFVDIYMRPMERLRQARDRTIVPRFEYERLLSTKLPEAASRYKMPPTGLEYLTLNRETGDGDADLKWRKSHRHMPAHLRWQAGPAREVASAIEEGYTACLNDIYAGIKRTNPDKKYNELSGNLGSLYGGVRKLTSLKDTSKANKSLHLFLLELQAFQQLGEVSGDPEANGDILLMATGLGIDVPGEYPVEVAPRQSPLCDCRVKDEGLTTEVRTPVPPEKTVYEFPSEQRSYWDPAKPELDLSEARASEIVVVGNSDSAAGAVFATLLREFDHCTFKTLAKMILSVGPDGQYTPTQLWFQRVRKAVTAWLNQNTKRKALTETEQWHYALRDRDVQGALFKPDAALNDEMTNKYLRTTRKVLVAIKSRKAFKDRVEEVQSGRAAPSPLDPGDLLAAEMLMSRAWPENRLLAACLFTKLEVKLVDIGGTDPGRLKITRGSDRMRGTYKLEGNAVPLERFGNMLDPAPFREREFKYVLNCAGPEYFQHRGNRKIPKGEETSGFLGRVLRYFKRAA